MKNLIITSILVSLFTTACIIKTEEVTSESDVGYTKVETEEVTAEPDGPATDTKDSELNHPEVSDIPERPQQTDDNQTESEVNVPGCPKILRPVCGENGLSYDNSCLAELDGINVYTSGQCEEIISDTLITQEPTFEEEQTNLLTMLEELYSLSGASACRDISNFTYTAVGSKPCGGPAGYIAYSLNIDTENFLEKVEAYTNAQKEYNKKRGVFSTCDVIPEPSRISCENGQVDLYP